MVCQQCLCFLQDYLEFPCKIAPCSSKRLSSLTRTIANELYRILTTVNSHHNMVNRVKREYVNLVEKKVHIPAKPLELHLFDVALQYYTYMYPSKEKKLELDQTVQLISLALLDHSIVKYHKSSDPTLNAKLWTLEKYFFCIEHLKDIHDEHSGKKSIDNETLIFTKSEKVTDEEIQSWDDLYS